jgi:hypothetical protein
LYAPIGILPAELDADEVVDAGCRHRDFSGCSCGIRYVPKLSDFRRFADNFAAHPHYRAEMLASSAVIYARGTAVGDVDYDWHRDATGSSVVIDYLRTTRFRVRQCAVIDSRRPVVFTSITKCLDANGSGPPPK